MATYDRLDWHLDSAIESGYPPENAFTHIGLYLAWIIRHDLHDPAIFPASHVAAVKDGTMTGSDLSDDIDTKLLPLDMNAEGRAFSDARYGAYMTAYSKEFGDEPDYAVVDDPASYARVERVIDALYASWVAEGRPAPEEASDDLDEPGDSELDFSFIDVTELPDAETMSRLAPDLESLIPADLTDPPMRVNSVRASAWGSSLLNRALLSIAVDPKDATVVVAMGGSGPGMLTVTLYDVPGVPGGQLFVEMEPAIALPPGGRWSHRDIGGRVVRWAPGAEFCVAFWAKYGLVIHVAGSAQDIEAAVPRLP